MQVLVEWMADAERLDAAAAAASPEAFGGLSMIIDGTLAGRAILEEALRDDEDVRGPPGVCA